MDVMISSCNQDPTIKCGSVYPSVYLINFDTTDLKTMCLYKYKQYGNFDSLQLKDSIGESFTFPNGEKDTFMISGTKGPTYGYSFMELFSADYILTMRNDVKIKLHNLLFQQHTCKVPYGQTGVYCPCRIMRFDIETTNCKLNHLTSTGSYIFKQ
jgi:hypothetical protein